MTLAKRLRLEALYWDGLFATAVVWILFGALPLLAILVAALITGDFPVEGEPRPEGFPAFSPPWWGLYLLTALLAVVVVISMPLPLRGSRSFSRGTLVILCALTLSSTIFAMGAVALIENSFRGLDVLVTVQGVLLLAVVARMVLGWFRLVPRKWREYVDDEGRVVPPGEVVRPERRRPWSGELPTRGARS
ncbi:MAG TPA: hypothetical protein VFY91_05345 [Microbacterium sp.]|nr:hypothetical protein [Microbacterium sp.]